MHEIAELCTFVDSLPTEKVGICYNFGHAHMGGHIHAKDIRTMGSRLVATHVADNHGKRDEHLMPFYGTIGWESSIQALREVSSKGI